jgi:hypothetical protein
MAINPPQARGLIPASMHACTLKKEGTIDGTCGTQCIRGTRDTLSTLSKEAVQGGIVAPKATLGFKPAPLHLPRKFSWLNHSNVRARQGLILINRGNSHSAWSRGIQTVLCDQRDETSSLFFRILWWNIYVSAAIQLPSSVQRRLRTVTTTA